MSAFVYLSTFLYISFFILETYQIEGLSLQCLHPIQTSGHKLGEDARRFCLDGNASHEERNWINSAHSLICLKDLPVW